MKTHVKRNLKVIVRGKLDDGTILGVTREFGYKLSYWFNNKRVKTTGKGSHLDKYLLQYQELVRLSA